MNSWETKRTLLRDSVFRVWPFLRAIKLGEIAQVSLLTMVMIQLILTEDHRLTRLLGGLLRVSLVALVAHSVIIATGGSDQRQWQRRAKRRRVRVAHPRRVRRQGQRTARHWASQRGEHRRCWRCHRRTAHRRRWRIDSLLLLASVRKEKNF